MSDLVENPEDRFLTTRLISFVNNKDIDQSSQEQSLVKTFVVHFLDSTYEPPCEQTGLRGFRPGPTQTRLYSQRRWLEACDFVFRKNRDCTICVAKTKTLISFAVTAKLICVFVFAYAKSRFSHDEAHMTYTF